MALKNWNNGETFSGSDMDDLVKGGYIRLANAAQRDAVLVGDLAPSQGMHVAMQDDNLTYRYDPARGWIPPIGTLMVYMIKTYSVARALNSATVYVQAPYDVYPVSRNWGSWFNATTGRFTPQLAGLYEIGFGVSIYDNAAGGSGYRLAALRMNGSTYIQQATHVEYGGNKGYTAMAYIYAGKPTVLQFNGTTDYVEVIAYHNNSLNLTTHYGDKDTGYFYAKFAGAV